MTKKLTAAQRTGKIGELIVERLVFGELGFNYHPSGDLEAGTDGFIEICSLDTGAPTGRYIAVQIKTTKGARADYSASEDDVLYWQSQNLPFLLLRVLERESLVLWKLVDSETRPGTISFSRATDVLDRTAAAALARLVDDRHLVESKEFLSRLAAISLERAAEGLRSENYQRSLRHCDRALHLARAAGIEELRKNAYVLRSKVRDRASSEEEAGSAEKFLEKERVWRSIDGLNVPHADERIHSARVLGALGAAASESLPALCTALNYDDDAEVRAEAAKSIGLIAIAEREVVRSLVRASCDEDFRVVHESVEALKKLGEGLEAHIRKLLRDTDDSLRLRGAEIAATLNVDVSQAALVIAGFLAPTHEPEIRHRAAYRLRVLSIDHSAAGAAVVDKLIASLSDSDEEVREDCAWALGIVGGAAISAARHLLDLLADEESRVRCGAARALGGIGEATPQIFDGLKQLVLNIDEHYSVRTEAAESLGRLFQDHESASEVLIAALKDSQSSVRESAAKGLKLSKENTERALPPLLAALADPHHMVRRAVAAALIHVTPAADDEVIAALITALSDRDYQVSSGAASCLGAIGPGASAALTRLRELPATGSWGSLSPYVVAIGKIEEDITIL